MTFDHNRTWAIVLAGGEGTRLASLTAALYGSPLPKQFAARASVLARLAHAHVPDHGARFDACAFGGGSDPAAGHEAAIEQLKTTLRGVAVADAMVAEFQTLAPDSRLGSAATRLASGFQHDFPVLEAGRVVGMLTRNDILRGLAMHRPDAPVRDLMHVRFPMANTDEELEQVLGRLPPDGSAVVVFQDDRLVGLLDPEHVGELLAIRGATPGGAS